MRSLASSMTLSFLAAHVEWEGGLGSLTEVEMQDSEVMALLEGGRVH